MTGLVLKMEGLGTPDAQSAELMSYLLFDTAYTRTLVDIGYRDASERADEIEAFLAEGVRVPAVPPSGVGRMNGSDGVPADRTRTP